MEELVVRFYGAGLKLPHRLTRKYGTVAYQTDKLLGIIWDLEPAGEAITAIARKLGYPIAPLDDDQAKSLLANVAVEFFANSNPENADPKDTSRPLGPMAINLVCYYTGLETVPNALALMEEPVLHAYGSVEQTFLDLLVQARKIDQSGGNWPLLLRAMTLPHSDAIFSARSTRVEATGVSRIGFALKSRFEMLLMYPSL